MTAFNAHLLVQKGGDFFQNVIVDLSLFVHNLYFGRVVSGCGGLLGGQRAGWTCT